MFEEKLEQKPTEPTVLFTSDHVAEAAIQEISSYLPPAIMGVVKSYAADDKDPLDTENIQRIVRGTQGFFPRETIFDFLHSTVYGEPEQVVAMFRKYPGLLLKKVSKFTVPCGDILFDVCPLDVMMFYLDWHMLQSIKQVLKECPVEFKDSVAAQCNKMRGGGTDLVKMTEDPRTEDFTQFVIDDDITYTLLQNNDGLVLYKDKLFYVTQSKSVKEIDESSIPAELKKEFTAFKAEFNKMEDNTGTRSSNLQHELIKRALGITLERSGIRYQRKGIEYQDTQVGMELAIAYRRYYHIISTRQFDSIDRVWEDIGRKQRQSIQMLQWICGNIPFRPLPDENRFKNGPFKRTLQFKKASEISEMCSVAPCGSSGGLNLDFTLFQADGKGFAYGCPKTDTNLHFSVMPSIRPHLEAVCRIMKVGKVCITEFSDELQGFFTPEEVKPTPTEQEPEEQSGCCPIM